MLKVGVRVTEPGQGEIRIGGGELQTILLVTVDDLDALDVAIEELRAKLNHRGPEWLVITEGGGQ